MKTIEGIIPVMLTPFTADNKIDYLGLKRLIDWYIENGADALFAVCQSSEMQYLTLEERVELASFVVEYSQQRVPVIASGHISDDLEQQIQELNAMAATGIDALVLVTNHLDPHNEGTTVFLRTLDALLMSLPESMALGLYECPAPYRRLLTDEELLYCAQSGRFQILKDVSCDLPTVTRRVQLTQHTPMMKWSTKTGHRVRVFSSIDFPIRLVVTHHYIRAVLVRCNIQRYSPLLRELHR